MMSDVPSSHFSGTLGIPRRRLWCIAVFWPSFLVAGLATVLFFATFDPANLIPGADPLGVYTGGFFLAWLFHAASSVLSFYFQKPCRRHPPDS